MSPAPEWTQDDIDDIVALIMDKESPLFELKNMEVKR